MFIYTSGNFTKSLSIMNTTRKSKVNLEIYFFIKTFMIIN